MKLWINGLTIVEDEIMDQWDYNSWRWNYGSKGVQELKIKLWIKRFENVEIVVGIKRFENVEIILSKWDGEICWGWK